MMKLGGGFWDGGPAREATSTLETLGSIHVEDGPTADHAFHVSQLAIILDRTSSRIIRVTRITCV
ncbi:hypothetical protein DEU56DRAFT_837147 [Suillus clintonianus]|uniref:uncharacterized protein n=1 Tax=Suillus clintonianus TaxID=1904413 RepID=UPI001B860319|nr:uncharacterized protein DEU56DRAFT_837147 [Suillus clintonianus]KAG2119308.1 hypothetical protein DEU56DRAFT_837147 [Suillus clintonianus]